MPVIMHARLGARSDAFRGHTSQQHAVLQRFSVPQGHTVILSAEHCIA